jgi:hypothetical protein
MAKKTEVIKVTYNPNAGFWQGVPARDLSIDEWMQLDANLRGLLIFMKMYTEVTKPIEQESN